MEPTEKKKCNKCLDEKPVSEFGIRKWKDVPRVKSTCRSCENVYFNKYRIEKAEQIKINDYLRAKKQKPSKGKMFFN